MVGRDIEYFNGSGKSMDPVLKKTRTDSPLTRGSIAYSGSDPEKQASNKLAERITRSK